MNSRSIVLEGKYSSQARMSLIPPWLNLEYIQRWVYNSVYTPHKLLKHRWPPWLCTLHPWQVTRRADWDPGLVLTQGKIPNRARPSHKCTQICSPLEFTASHHCRWKIYLWLSTAEYTPRKMQCSSCHRKIFLALTCYLLNTKTPVLKCHKFFKVGFFVLYFLFSSFSPSILFSFFLPSPPSLHPSFFLFVFFLFFFFSLFLSFSVFFSLFLFLLLLFSFFLFLLLHFLLLLFLFPFQMVCINMCEYSHRDMLWSGRQNNKSRRD